MFKIILGGIVVYGLITFSDEIKQHAVESGLRDQIVNYLNSF